MKLCITEWDDDEEEWIDITPEGQSEDEAMGEAIEFSDNVLEKMEHKTNPHGNED
jgi:hypothetical protein